MDQPLQKADEAKQVKSEQELINNVDWYLDGE